MSEEVKKPKRRKSIKKTISSFLKSSKPKETTETTIAEEPVAEETTMTEETQVAVAETKVETTSEEVDQKVEAPVQKSDVDKKKLLFAASVLAVAAKLLIDKAAKKKVVAPPAPEYDIKCLPLQGVAKKTGIPLMCFKIPKKMVFEFKNKELKVDLPSLYFKKF